MYLASLVFSWYTLYSHTNLLVRLYTKKILVTSKVFHGIPRVRMGPVKPGKSWNFILAFSRTGKFWKSAKLN